jgi:hypothetical protein
MSIPCANLLRVEVIMPDGSRESRLAELVYHTNMHFDEPETPRDQVARPVANANEVLRYVIGVGWRSYPR